MPPNVFSSTGEFYRDLLIWTLRIYVSGGQYGENLLVKCQGE